MGVGLGLRADSSHRDAETRRWGDAEVMPTKGWRLRDRRGAEDGNGQAQGFAGSEPL